MVPTHLKTTEFTINIGLTPGYHHRNETAVTQDFAQKAVGRIWQELAEQVYRKLGVYVAGVVIPAQTVYRTDWGCPVGGEVTCTISGLHNTQVAKPARYDLWKWAVKEIARLLGERFQQTTVYLTFRPVEFHYLKPAGLTKEKEQFDALGDNHGTAIKQ